MTLLYRLSCINRETDNNKINNKINQAFLGLEECFYKIMEKASFNDIYFTVLYQCVLLTDIRSFSIFNSKNQHDTKLVVANKYNIFLFIY